jgi:hypothetical protein
MKKIIFVEDTYGVGFHRTVLEKLKEVKELDNSFNPRIERLPTGKCNPGLRGKVISRSGGEDTKILIVADTEGKPDEVRNCIDKIFSNVPLNIHITTAFADTRHETWLCIGLGGDKTRCRQDPEHELRKLRDVRDYRKEHLSEWAKDIDVCMLLEDHDFRKYVETLKHLDQDP